MSWTSSNKTSTNLTSRTSANSLSRRTKRLTLASTSRSSSTSTTCLRRRWTSTSASSSSWSWARRVPSQYLIIILSNVERGVHVRLRAEAHWVLRARAQDVGEQPEPVLRTEQPVLAQAAAQPLVLLPEQPRALNAQGNASADRLQYHTSQEARIAHQGQEGQRPAAIIHTVIGL